MIVIIDTNVLLSAALRDRGPEEVVLYVAATPGIRWVASPEIVAEYRAVIRRPRFKFPETVVERWDTLIQNAIIIVDVAIRVPFVRDGKDASFLECALATGADFLITGDRDFEEARKLVDTTILSVGEFKARAM